MYILKEHFYMLYTCKTRPGYPSRGLRPGDTPQSMSKLKKEFMLNFLSRWKIWHKKIII